MKKLSLFLVFLLFAFSAHAQMLESSSGNIPLATSTGHIPLVGGLPPIWQGMGQGMKLTLQGLSNSSSVKSRVVRTPHYSNVAFRYFQVVIPTSFSWDTQTGVTTLAATGSGGNTLTFAATPLSYVGEPVTDITTPGAIPANTTLLSSTRTIVTLSAGTTVAMGDTISFAVAGAPIHDQLYQGAQGTLSFQIGFEYPYTHGNTGLSARIPVTFSGANYFTYVYGSAQGNACSGGCMVSDVIDACSLGQCVNGVIPAGVSTGQFGLLETIETPTALASTIPYTQNLTNYTERYIGSIDSSTSQIAALGGASDVALNATSMPHLATAEEGFSLGISPAFMKILVPAGSKSVLLDGDCLTYGNEEGTYPAWTTGTHYVTGAQVASNVYSGGGIYTNQTSSCTAGPTAPTGTSPVSDGACTWAFTPGASLAGDTDGDANSNVGASERWVGETLGLNFVNFGRGADKFFYRATSSNWTYRQQLMAMASPSALLQQLGHNDLSSGESASAINGYAQTTFALIHAHVPGLKIIQMAQTPGSISSDDFVTSGGQSALSNFGSSSSARGVFNDTYIRTCGSSLGSVGFVDTNPALEFSYVEGNTASETSLWNVTGWQQGYTADGVHWTSLGSQLAANNMYATNASCMQVSNPF